MCAFTSMNSGLGRQLRSGAATHRPGSRASVGFGKRNALGTPAPQRRRFSGRVLRPNGRFVSTVGDLAGVRTPASSGVADLLDAQEVQDSKQEKLEGPYHGKKAVVVGAGPGGSMAAIVLAKRGFDVKVFEKRKDPSAAATKIRRSVVFLLTPEVTQLLLDVGIQVPSGKFSNGITAYQHTTITDPSGNVKTFRMQIDNGKRVLTERQCVANAVLQAAVSQKLPNLEFVFESACEDVDVGAKVVRFSNGDGEMEEVPYDLLIGADGANSLVRGALQNSGHVEFTQKKCRQKYICVRDIPASDDLAAEVGVVNFFQAKKKWLEETPVNAVYYRSENNRIQMNFLATEKAFENLKGIESEWTQEAFPPSIPREWRDRIASALQKGDLSTIGPVTYCSSYIGPNIALIGDACHSATPTLGIGANQAILDVKALDGALGKSNGNMEEALQAYDQETRPQVAAIQELEKNHVFSLLEGQDPFWKAFHFIYFQFHRHGSRWLPKVIPPSVFQQLGASAITPKEALEKFCREAFIFSGIVGAAACVAAALGLKAFSGGVV